METKNAAPLETVARVAQVISVVAGVVVSVLSFNATRAKEAEAMRVNATKPFLELRQKLYLEAVKAAGVLSNPEVHTQDEQLAARKRFRELYVAELSMVEEAAVEAKMVTLAGAIDPELLSLTPEQKAAYDLSHALRDSFVESWGIAARSR